MKQVRPSHWIFISLGGFIAFALFLYILLTTERKTELSQPLYFFLIVVIGLVATGFLAGAMKSKATYQTNTPKGSLYLAGPIVVFCVILYLGYQYRPTVKSSPLSLSVQLIGPDSEEGALTQGSVNMTTGLFRQTKNVDDSGNAFFTGIDPDYKGKPIVLLVNVPGYHLSSTVAYRLSDSMDHTNLMIKLQKNVVQTLVQGRLVSLPGKLGIAAATIHFAGTNVSVETNDQGDFSAKLPVKSGFELRIIAVKNNIQVYNSLRSVFQNDYLILTEDQ